MKGLMEIRDMLCEELEEISSKGELSAGSLDTVHKLTDTVKNIDKILMLEESEYSRDGEWEARGGYGGESYANRRMHYVRGHYSRDGGYARRGGGYSRNDGYSRDGGKESMMADLEELMQNATTEKERTAIRRCISQLKDE